MIPTDKGDEGLLVAVAQRLYLNSLYLNSLYLNSLDLDSVDPDSVLVRGVVEVPDGVTIAAREIRNRLIKALAAADPGRIVMRW